MVPKSHVTVSVAKPSEAIFTIHGFTRGTPLVYQGIGQSFLWAQRGCEVSSDRAGPFRHSQSRNCMSKKKPIVRERKIAIDPDPRGNLKALGGGEYDDWNNWLASRTSLALPVNQKDDDRATEATVAVYSGMIDLKPADPIEGILISQLVAENQASVEIYRRA